MTVTAIQIGLDPDVVDYSSPDFARFTGLTREKLRAANDDNIALLRGAGYDVDGCPVDLGETALDEVRAAITAKAYDVVLIGAGVRLVASNTLLFESIVNLVHATLPDARFVFNRDAETSPDDIRRYFPDPDPDPGHAPQPVPNQAEMKLRPRNTVTAILPGDQRERCVSALSEAGVDTATVDVLSGPDGARILDHDGTRHGMAARVTRWFQMLGSAENELVNYSTALQGGAAVVAVPVADEEHADAVGRVLGTAGGTRILYFRSTAVERL